MNVPASQTEDVLLEGCGARRLDRRRV